jgi:DNA-binding transcriptional LysR family regulator
MHGLATKPLDLTRAISSIDLRNLSYFAAVAETQSFREGAEVLRVRQPTVSRQVRDLEDALGVDLFERRPGEGVRLTPAGRAFLPKAQKLLADFDRACAEAGRAGRAESGTLGVAFTTSLTGGHLHALLGTFHRKHPEVAVSLLEGNATDQLLALKDRGCDIIFLAGTFEAPGAEHETLWIERVHVALPVGHRLADAVFVSWEDLEPETVLTRSHASGPGIDRWLAGRLAPNGLLPRLVMQSVARENLIGLVAAGFGVTILAASATGITYPGVVFRPLRDETASLAVTAAWLPGNPNPALRRLLGLAREMARAAQSHGSPSAPPSTGLVAADATV